jgi:hypothetical protein
VCASAKCPLGSASDRRCRPSPPNDGGATFFSATQTSSIGFLPMFRDWCPYVDINRGIQPNSPSGEGLGYGRSGFLYVFAAH